MAASVTGRERGTRCSERAGGRRRFWGAGGATAAVLGAAVLAGCGSSGPPATITTTTAPPIPHATVTTGQTSYGTVLTTGKGITLYAFSADTPTASVCTGACTVSLRPYETIGAPHAAGGASAALLSTISRTEVSGHRTQVRFQVVYAGHPLYTSVLDIKPGSARAQGVGLLAITHVVAPSGQVVMTPPPRPKLPTTTTKPRH